MIEDYITELKLSRAFVNEFAAYLDWCRAQNVAIDQMFPDLIKKFDELNKHYTIEIERGIQ